jgi:hypothetical protein
MTEHREQLIQAAEAAYQQEQDRADKFRAYYCAHFGQAPGTVHEQCEAIIRSNDAQELTDDQLRLLVQWGAGVPPGYFLTEDQIQMAANELLERP